MKGFSIQTIIPTIKVVVDRVGRVVFSFFQDKGSWTVIQSRDVDQDVYDWAMNLNF